MPMAATPVGKTPACIWPKRPRALIMGCLRPSNWAEPSSARNSRWRLNQATIMLATKPSTMSSTMLVT